MLFMSIMLYKLFYVYFTYTFLDKDCFALFTNLLIMIFFYFLFMLFICVLLLGIPDIDNVLSEETTLPKQL